MALSCCKKLPAFLRGIAGNNNGDFFYLNCFRPYTAENKLKNIYKYVKIMLLTHCSFDTTKNKLDCYRGKNCMKNFCLDLEKTCNKNNEL